MKSRHTSNNHRSNPIHRHYWSHGCSYSTVNEHDLNKNVMNLYDLNWDTNDSPSDNTDGQEMREFRVSVSGQKKRDFSEAQGESFGHLYVIEELGYKEFFHGDNKSIAQGLDSIYREPQTNKLVVVEFKGQTSNESKAQKKEGWTIETCEKVQAMQFPYQNVSQYEWEMAGQILDAYHKGEKIRYEVVRTEVNEKTGEFWTQLEKQTILQKMSEDSEKFADVEANINEHFGESIKEYFSESLTDSAQEFSSESHTG